MLLCILYGREKDGRAPADIIWLMRALRRGHSCVSKALLDLRRRNLISDPYKDARGNDWVNIIRKGESPQLELGDLDPTLDPDFEYLETPFTVAGEPLYRRVEAS